MVIGVGSAARGGRIVCLVGVDGAHAQSNFLTFRSQIRPTPPNCRRRQSRQAGAEPGGGGRRRPIGKMLVQADEMNYDYNNSRVSAVGNVQIYHNGATLEADKVIYDQRTKRVHAEGNVRLTEANGKITYGEIIDLSEDFRDGFVDSLRVDTRGPDPHGRRARRPHRRQFHGAAERRLHGLRALPRRSAQAAAVAGQGRAHHP